jgi:hypothetical protein
LAQLAQDSVDQKAYAAFTASVPWTIHIKDMATLRAAQSELLGSSIDWVLKRSETNRGRDLHVLKSSDGVKLADICSEEGPWVWPRVA